MVHGPEQKGVQAENVAGDHNGQNLPFAIGQEPVAECISLCTVAARQSIVTRLADADALAIGAAPIS